MKFWSFVYRLRRLDLILLGSVFFLLIIGLISIYSSSLGRGDFSNFNKQLAFVVIGLSILLSLSFFNWRILRDDPYFVLTLYFIFVLALAGVFIFAPEVRGVKKWYQIGLFSFDPAEFINIVLIIVLAKYFSTRHIEMYRLIHIFISFFYFLIPSILLFFQPDIGAIIVMFCLWFGILLISGIKLRHLILLVVAGLIFCILAWFYFLHDYQKQRIISFLFPTDPQGASWSQNQAKIAVGSGGLFGKGFGSGSQTQLKYLPEPQTDFIFAAIAEEFGFVGVFILFLCYGILTWRIILTAINSTSNFPRLFATGVAILFAAKIFINVSMNIGLLPVIGIPLPLVSYGGSSLISALIAIGIIQSFKIG